MEYQLKIREFIIFLSSSPSVSYYLYKYYFKFILIYPAITTVASGGLISAFGHYVPLLLIGGTLTTIGVGLLYTLQIGSKSSHWIGFQVLAGLGIGLSFQIPQIVAQSVCELSEVSHYTAISLCKPQAPLV